MPLRVWGEDVPGQTASHELLPSRRVECVRKMGGAPNASEAHWTKAAVRDSSSSPDVTDFWN